MDTNSNFITTLLVGLGLFIVIMLLFKSFNREGMETQSQTDNTASAGKASDYSANIKSEAIKLQDTLLVSKYRDTYEDVIIHLDDYIQALMLKTSLNVDPKDPMNSMDKLSKLYQAKQALNTVMSYVDNSSS